MLSKKLYFMKFYITGKVNLFMAEFVSQSGGCGMYGGGESHVNVTKVS